MLEDFPRVWLHSKDRVCIVFIEVDFDLFEESIWFRRGKDAPVHARHEYTGIRSHLLPHIEKFNFCEILDLTPHTKQLHQK